MHGSMSSAFMHVVTCGMRFWDVHCSISHSPVRHGKTVPCTGRQTERTHP